MTKIQTFKDLTAWQQAHNLVLFIYKITDSFPKTELFALNTQMRRAAISITSNIAEGFGRSTSKDKRHFYTISKGSLLELDSQIAIANDLQYITN